MDACSKWVYSSEKIVLRIFSISYLQKWAGEIAPILVKIRGLLALLRIAKINQYSIPALAPFMVVQQTTCLNH
jgi:hypothetical protein